MQKEGFAVRHRSTSIRRSIRALAVVTVAALSVPLGLGSASAGQLPDRIALPDGSQPEGLAITNRGTFYTGSLADGTIWVGDVQTGDVRRLVPGGAGRVAVGVEVRGRFVWVAGGDTGMAWVFRRSGDLVRTYRFEPGLRRRRGRHATGGVLHRLPAAVPLSSADRRRPRLARRRCRGVALRGDLVFEDGFNANGIDRVPGTSMFVVVQTNTGELFAVRPSGRTREIDLGGADVASGDGVLVIDHVAYVVQNFLNTVAKVRLSDDLSSGRVVSRTGDPDFDVPRRSTPIAARSTS